MFKTSINSSAKAIGVLLLVSLFSIGHATETKIQTPVDLGIEDCRQALMKINKHEQAKEIVDQISALDDKLEKLRTLNGQHERVSTLERARRFAYLRQKMTNGVLTQVSGNYYLSTQTQLTSMYRTIFRETELAYYDILFYEAELKKMSERPTEVINFFGTEVDEARKTMLTKLNMAYRDLGENYVEYITVRDYLEDQILKDVQVRNKVLLISHGKLTEEDFVDSIKAKIVLQCLGHADVSKRLQDLGLDPNLRPEISKIREMFGSRIMPMIALLKRDIKEERGTRVFKFSYWTIASLQRAIMLLGSKGITIKGAKIISSPLIQQVLGSLLLMSRDDYLRRQYLHQVEYILQTPTDGNQRVKVLMEHCNEKCNELLETFARLGYLTEEWSDLKDAVEPLKDESKQYARLLKLMNEAEDIAEERHGLALNYHQLSDDRGKQSIFSAAAVAFWTTLLTGHGSDVIQMLHTAQIYLFGLLGL